MITPAAMMAARAMSTSRGSEAQEGSLRNRKSFASTGDSACVSTGLLMVASSGGLRVPARSVAGAGSAGICGVALLGAPLAARPPTGRRPCGRYGTFLVGFPPAIVVLQLADALQLASKGKCSSRGGVEAAAAGFGASTCQAGNRLRNARLIDGAQREKKAMHSIIYLVGLVVVVLAVISLLA
jgi:hypothetical protein